MYSFSQAQNFTEIIWGKGNRECLTADLSVVSPVLLKQDAEAVGLWKPEISPCEWYCEKKSLWCESICMEQADVGSPCRAAATMFMLHGWQFPRWEGVERGALWDPCMLGFGDISLAVSDSSEPFADLLKVS